AYLDGSTYYYPRSSGGGGGGTGPSGPGLGGVASTEVPFPAANGSAGSGRNGGAGADDLTEDAGGGGGGGWHGGGGGAATAADSLAGSGGGGGSGYVASSGTAVSAFLGPATTVGPAGETGANPGANGSVTITWDTASCASATDDEKLYEPHGPVAV